MNKRFFIFLALLSAALNGEARTQPFQFPEAAPPQIDLPQIDPLQLTQTKRPAAALQNIPAVGQGALAIGTSVRLSAMLTDGSPLLAKGVVWRVYSERADDVQELTLVTQSDEAQPHLRLPPGVYVINAAFGHASVTRRLQVGPAPIQDHFILNAGGFLFNGVVTGKKIPDQKLTASIYTGPGAGGILVMENAQAGKIVRLPAGDYHIVSHYGDANAILAADIRIQAGKVTEATLHHHASQIILKLVKERGGEALANTTWSILTPGGDTVKEVIGAFPSVVLEQGSYNAIARNEGRVFTASFKVEPGHDAELEVLTQ